MSCEIKQTDEVRRLGPKCSKQEILTFVSHLMSSEFGIAAESIAPNRMLVEELGLDSIDLCDTLVRLEGETGHSFPLEKFRHVSTVSDLAETALTVMQQN